MLNAILHATGDLGPHFYFKNVTTMEFYEMFRKPYKRDSKPVMFFRHFDDFYRLEPALGQELLEMLAHDSYSALCESRRFLNCIHWADKNLKLQRVLKLHARWITRQDFSEEADAQRAREHAAGTWWGSLVKRSRSDNDSMPLALSVFSSMQDITGHQSALELQEANIAEDELLALLHLHEKAMRWWNSAIEEFSAQDEKRLWPRFVSGALENRVNRRKLVALFEENLSQVAAFQLLEEAIEARSELTWEKAIPLKGGWLNRITWTLEARRGQWEEKEVVAKALKMVGEFDGGFEPTYQNSTPETAVERLLQLEAKVWEQLRKENEGSPQIVKLALYGKDLSLPLLSFSMT
ncbi:hypothetical protein EON80_16825 [bacterium]|nr:MAG: hypothetical protein EON80_16825 [bacterium]